ncbi:hypothetical protein FQA39_LY02716 [Lamprigera yunnana]|nr:hypothetical protein FQA39_LY02716 [Lamprigera yunnana]
MSSEPENAKLLSSEVKQMSEDVDGNTENSAKTVKKEEEGNDPKEVNSKVAERSTEADKVDKKESIKSADEDDVEEEEEDEEEEDEDDVKDEKKVEDKKEAKSEAGATAESSKEDEGSKKEEKKGSQASEPSSEKSAGKKKTSHVTEDSNSGDAKEIKTDVPIGTGNQLGDIPRIDASISRFKNDDLKLLHRLLYKTPGKTTLIKKNIKKFNGFDFKKDSEEYNKKIDSAKKFELKQLKSICEMLDLEKKGSKDEIIERVIHFLLEPKDSGKAIGGGRPKRTAAVRANNRGYSSHDDSYSSDDRRGARGGRGKGRRTNLKDDTTSESDEDFHPSDASEGKTRGPKRKKGGGRKRQYSEEDEDDVSAVDESMTSEDSDEEPRKRKKNKKIVVVNTTTNHKGRGRPKGSGRKALVDVEKKTTPKKVNKKNKESSGESEAEDANSSSSEDEPLIKKSKSVQPPTDEEIRKYVKEILDGANLEEITMKTVCKQVYAHYPDFDLAHKKDFIKVTVKSLIST